ncbi:hypothetical protein H312_02633 [Anncaliia algerae PRA339]|uniref:Uncharacterized protein n=1 Tax=Anncaliia algerae PRA339 TaxID=1288291 RepID=A0A059EYI2_9MICR|nr:hypothetical protein H312_02624 [Anncaliia algerae PRA339]KCZ79984.1 hypothetical protein H312_02633 [Anncaliia algerae PRA339]
MIIFKTIIFAQFAQSTGYLIIPASNIEFPYVQVPVYYISKPNPLYLTNQGEVLHPYVGTEVFHQQNNTTNLNYGDFTHDYNLQQNLYYSDSNTIPSAFLQCPLLPSSNSEGSLMAPQVSTDQYFLSTTYYQTENSFNVTPNQNQNFQYNSDLSSCYETTNFSNFPESISMNDKLCKYGVYCINPKNFLYIFSNLENDKIAITFHSCYNTGDSKFNSIMNPVQNCSNNEFTNEGCFVVWFSKNYIESLKSNIDTSENFKKFKKNLFKYLKWGSNDILKGFSDNEINSMINHAWKYLKNNKVSIAFFFATTIFRLRNLMKYSTLFPKNGISYNLFENLKNSNVNIEGSIYFSIIWWSGLGFNTELENNIILVFDVVFRNFLVLSSDNKIPREIFDYFQIKIIRSLKILYN